MRAEMTPRQRLLTVLNGGIPDHVPVIPDMSNMIPARLTGKPFWDIYLHNDPPLYAAYANAAKHFGFDGWYQAYDAISFQQANAPTRTSQIISRSDERIVERAAFHTAKGDLWEEITYMRADPPTVTIKKIKDFEADFEKVKCFYGDIVSHDASRLESYREMCGEDGVFTLVVGYPGMHSWSGWFHDGLQGAVYAYADFPECFDEWAALEHKFVLRQAEIMLSYKPDLLLLGASGTLTLSTPELVRKYSLPTIQQVCRMAKQAGVPTMLHSCGKSMAFFDMLVNETDLDCINPLEEPPMGDVNLAEVKKLYGDRICLMGNLHTSEVMLMGSPDDVEAAAKKAIDDAAKNGRFLLSTGDQCGRDTPDTNIFKLVEVAKTYGQY